YENDFRELGRPAGVYIKSDDFNDTWNVNGGDMRVLTTGGALDPVTRTVPVLFEISNVDNILNINQSMPVEVYGTAGKVATAIPITAIYEDEGMDVVFVQAGGESFEKRLVTLGPKFAGWVTVLNGIQEGERVVSRGGYHVKLASTTAEIGHGHAH
ncbi:MAG TPA: efflux RND transporter periplasmic adaptor subunit, partial [candidate division Zixibacteria bacterium]|nr:efflux RND transporter periplasmic adaptor subunit [candidate division Zixibacteria bacterium]